MEAKCQCILMQMDGLIVYQHKLGNMSWIRDFLTIQREGVCYDTQQFGFVMNEGSYSAVVALYRLLRQSGDVSYSCITSTPAHTFTYVHLCFWAVKVFEVSHAEAVKQCVGLRGMRLWGNEVCFLSAGADGQGASPWRSENTAKKGIKPLQSAASLASCQTIPVKALFW